MTVDERNQWLIENDKLLWKITSKFGCGSCYDLDDIHTATVLGAIYALDHFDSNIAHGTSYIYTCAFSFARRFVNSNKSSVHVPMWVAEKGEQINALSFAKEDSNDLSLENAIGMDEKYDDIIAKVDFETKVASVPGKNKDVFEMLANGYERKEIANELGISTERVRQIILTHGWRIRKAFD